MERQWDLVGRTYDMESAYRQLSINPKDGSKALIGGLRSEDRQSQGLSNGDRAVWGSGLCLCLPQDGRGGQPHRLQNPEDSDDSLLWRFHGHDSGESDRGNQTCCGALFTTLGWRSSFVGRIKRFFRGTKPPNSEALTKRIHKKQRKKKLWYNSNYPKK